MFGAPSDEAERSEIIVACVAMKSGAVGDGLREFLLAKLPAWQVPRQWVLVKSLPTNQRGKLSRAEWRRRLLEGPGL